MQTEILKVSRAPIPVERLFPMALVHGAISGGYLEAARSRLVNMKMLREAQRVRAELRTESAAVKDKLQAGACARSLPCQRKPLSYEKVRQSVTSNSKSKKHGPITGSALGRNGLIRACEWSMLFAFAFDRNTLTHFVVPNASDQRC